MKLIDKLTIGHLSVSLLVIVVALVGINANNSINFAYDEISRETLPTIKALEDAKEASLRIVVSTSEFVSIKAESGHNGTAIGDVEKEQVISGIRQYDEAISRYEDLVNRFFPQEKDFLENIKTRGKKLQNVSNEIIILKEQGASGPIVLEKQEEFEAVEQEFTKAINDALANEDKEFADRNQDVNHAIATSVQNILIAGLLTFIIAIALGVNISKSISKPILELKNAAVNIGKGKLDTRVDIKKSDEVGILAACFNQMAQKIEHDIQEINKVETMERESEEKFRLIFENARDAIFWSDPETGLILRCNKAAENLLEKESQEIVGHYQSTLHSPEKAGFYADQFKRHFQEKGSIDEEAEVITKSGKIKHVQISASVTTVRGKQIMQGIFHDITERKLAEDALLESEESYRRLVDISPYGIAIHSEGKFVFMNQAGARILGAANPEELIGIAVLQIIHPDYREIVKERIRMQEEGKAAPLIEEKFIRLDGTAVDVELTSIPFTYKGKPSMYGVFLDITQRKRAEEALCRSELLLSEAERIAHLGNWEWDVQTNSLQWSDETYRILGYSPGEITLYKDTFINAIYPEDKENVEKALADALEKKKPYSIEHRVVRKDGLVSAVHSQGEITFDVSGKPVKMVGTMLDITGRKLAEEELKKHREHLEEMVKERTLALVESEEKFKSIFDNATDGILLADIGTKKFLMGNRMICEMLGFKEEELKNMSVNNIHPEKDLYFVTEQFEKLTRKEIDVALDIPVKRKDGSIFYADIKSGFVIIGGKTYLLGSFRDITERKRVEEFIKLEDKRLQSLLKISLLKPQTQDALLKMVLDEVVSLTGSKVGYIYYYNEEKEEFTLRAWSKNVNESCSIQNRQTTYHLRKTGIWGEAVRQRKPIIVNNFQAYNSFKRGYPEGHTPLFRFMTLPVFSDDRIVAVVGVGNKETDYNDIDLLQLKQMMDSVWLIVQRQQAEELMRFAKEEAEHANMAKTNFLQTMSHELRTPLNAVLGFSEMLKQKTSGELNEKQEHFIDNIITGGNNLLNIISQILDVVQMDEGTLGLYKEKIPVPETVDELIGVIKENAIKKNVIIEKKLDPELEYIEADKQKFKQVFINLLDNAVKFSKEGGGTVTITGKKEGDIAKFSVSDRGIGIKEEDIEKLFQKFTQLDMGTTRKYGGTGIGLAISKQFVELHGGRIWVKSKYGEGSTFTFTIPLLNKKKEEQ